MSVSEAKTSPIAFPGQIARLEVNIQSDFEEEDNFFLTKIWRFYNKAENPESLINRIEIWQDRTGIALVAIFFNKLGCKAIKEAFSDKMEAQFSHFHDYNWCKLQVTKHKDMQQLLDVINSAHEFVGDSQTIMDAIIKKVKDIDSNEFLKDKRILTSKV